MMRSLRYLFFVTIALAAVWAFAGTRTKPAPLDLSRYEQATLGGGCFWGVQENLRHVPGVIKTTAGYTGGTVTNPTYEIVAGGNTGHVEAVHVYFDPAKLSYEKLLAAFLDVNNPKRSKVTHRFKVFYSDDAQMRVVESTKAALSKSGKGDFAEAIDLIPATAFYPAEESHQDYYQKHLGSAGCVVN